MIVKNGGDELRQCLQSIAGLVQQIVIVDTGSTDNTFAVAAEFGAGIIHVPWTNHFADARNAALDRMTTDWVLVLDADEELSAEAVCAIPKLLEDGDGIGGYFLTIRNYLLERHVQFRTSTSVPNQDRHLRAQKALSWAEHDLCRLFRCHPAIRYEGRVHEVVEYSIQNLGLKIARSQCRILHFGQLADTNIHERKAMLYRDLGVAKVKEDPQNAMAWFELGGIELSQFNNQPVALKCLQHAVRLEPRIQEAWILLFHLHDHREEFDLALAVYQRLVALNAPIPFAIEQRSGDFLHDRSRLIEACDCYCRALSMDASDSVTVSQASRRVVESKLGYVKVRLGQNEGLEMLRRAAREASHIEENHIRLAKALFLIGDSASSARESEVTSFSKG
jgi:tetratricopeptide (TPR) repeat protein